MAKIDNSQKQRALLHVIRQDLEFQSNILLEFMVAYQRIAKRDTTIGVLQRACVVPQNTIRPALEKLENENWIYTWKNHVEHYHAYTLAEPREEKETETPKPQSSKCVHLETRCREVY